MSRRFFPHRRSVAETRQAEHEAQNEADFADLALQVLGEDTADAAIEEAAIESATHFQTGVGLDGCPIYKANVQLDCVRCLGKIGCLGKIERGDFFTSPWDEKPHLYAWCQDCKPIMVQMVPDPPELVPKIVRGKC